MLTSFYHVYDDTRFIERQFDGAPHPKPEMFIELTPRLISELSNIVSTLRFACVCMNDGFKTTVISFDASMTSGVIKYAHSYPADNA